MQWSAHRALVSRLSCASNFFPMMINLRLFNPKNIILYVVLLWALSFATIHHISQSLSAVWHKDGFEERTVRTTISLGRSILLSLLGAQINTYNALIPMLDILYVECNHPRHTKELPNRMIINESSRSTMMSTDDAIPSCSSLLQPYGCFLVAFCSFV